MAADGKGARALGADVAEGDRCVTHAERSGDGRIRRDVASGEEDTGVDRRCAGVSVGPAEDESSAVIGVAALFDDVDPVAGDHAIEGHVVRGAHVAGASAVDAEKLGAADAVGREVHSAAEGGVVTAASEIDLVADNADVVAHGL